MGIVTVKDVEADKFITAFSQHLKRQGRFEIPKWADVVKTGKAKELPPLDPDWLYVRTASMVRKIYIRGGTGVGGFRKVYGSQMRRGVQKNVYSKASGKIARYILQQLEEMSLVDKMKMVVARFPRRVSVNWTPWPCRRLLQTRRKMTSE